MLNYNSGIGKYKNWIVEERKFHKRYQGKCESIMALGNGYMGLRSAVEEPYIGQTRNLFVAGTYNKFDDYEVTELPNAADVTELLIHINGEEFSLDSGKVLEYSRKLNRKFGYAGAMYPWETAFTGEEETPEWAAINILTGKATRVWSALKEHHITADIAYAVWNYYLSTDDEDFMNSYGSEIIFECAEFWFRRLQWNKDKNRYEIKDLIGPDEYTEHIDNNAYTNYMTHYNF